MTSDIPRPKPDGNRGHRLHDSVVTPTQAIAEAWQRESPKNQEFWRQAEAKRREQYLAPRPPRPRHGPGSKM
ncbi:hypothetical protein J3R83DRAFT_3803, partial [Lanmaoa asiatica]